MVKAKDPHIGETKTDLRWFHILPFTALGSWPSGTTCAYSTQGP
eukprot:CAMPEP_0119489434 /NCGR_PEP_ID=MMETSP1344-20130328/14880_1 /TAXON_ID=236787 /ORGANISM="Florenciella parvula, Strain CCMP2471" /LENGTH=43 /DNA_ID= /DNA_START= /DNA_END= /DNA_ORIENTATION=